MRGTWKLNRLSPYMEIHAFVQHQRSVISKYTLFLRSLIENIRCFFPCEYPEINLISIVIFSSENVLRNVIDFRVKPVYASMNELNNVVCGHAFKHPETPVSKSLGK